jgi:hypothetical protein
MMDKKGMGELAKAKSRIKIKYVLTHWDYDKEGEVTVKRLAALTGMGKNTVLNHWEYFERERLEIKNTPQRRLEQRERNFAYWIEILEKAGNIAVVESMKKHHEESKKKEVEAKRKLEDDGWGF